MAEFVGQVCIENAPRDFVGFSGIMTQIVNGCFSLYNYNIIHSDFITHIPVLTTEHFFKEGIYKCGKCYYFKKRSVI